MGTMEQLFYCVMTKDKMRIMKGLSKSVRYLCEIHDESKPLSLFTTKESAEAWIKSPGRIKILYGDAYTCEDLEATPVMGTFEI